jgi:hypothetical protein
MKQMKDGPRSRHAVDILIARLLPLISWKFI